MYIIKVNLLSHNCRLSSASLRKIKLQQFHESVSKKTCLEAKSLAVIININRT